MREWQMLARKGVTGGREGRRREAESGDKEEDRKAGGARGGG